MNDSVRAAINAAIHANPAGLKGEAVALRMGVSVSVLYRWGEIGGKTIPLERLAQFTLITQDARPLAALCAIAGHTCIPAPDVAGLGAEPAALQALHDFSGFMQEHAAALLDGVIKGDELERIEKTGYEALLAVARVIALARAQRESGKGAI